MIRVSCPKCKAILQVEDKQAGQVIACSTCKTSLRLPQAPAPAPAPPVVAATSTPAPPPAIPKAIPTPPVPPAKQPAPASAQSAPAESQAAKLKSVWQGLTLPIKAALIGGTSFVFLSCFLCCGFLSFKTFSRSPDSGDKVAQAKKDNKTTGNPKVTRNKKDPGGKKKPKDDDYTRNLPASEAKTLVKRYIELSRSVPDDDERREMSQLLNTLVSHGAGAAPVTVALARMYVELSQSVPDDAEQKEMSEILSALGRLGVHARSASPILTARYNELSESVPDESERREMTLILQTTSKIR